MLRKEDFMMIQVLAQRGLYLCDIATQVGVHPRTVRRALARGGAPALRPNRRGSRLDPYRADIDRLLAEGVWNAVVIFRELQAKGYTGQLSILRDYIRPKRALRVRRATMRFETAPGQQLQSDWGEQARMGWMGSGFAILTICLHPHFRQPCPPRSSFM